MSKNISINSKIDSFNKKIKVASDKSLSIRCILLASQAIGKSKIYNLLESEDVLNALKIIKKLGIDYKKIEQDTGSEKGGDFLICRLMSHEKILAITEFI